MRASNQRGLFHKASFCCGLDHFSQNSPRRREGQQTRIVSEQLSLSAVSLPVPRPRHAKPEIYRLRTSRRIHQPRYPFLSQPLVNRALLCDLFLHRAVTLKLRFVLREHVNFSPILLRSWQERGAKEQSGKQRCALWHEWSSLLPFVGSYLLALLFTGRR